MPCKITVPAGDCKSRVTCDSNQCYNGASQLRRNISFRLAACDMWEEDGDEDREYQI